MLHSLALPGESELKMWQLKVRWEGCSLKVGEGYGRCLFCCWKASAILSLTAEAYLTLSRCPNGAAQCHAGQLVWLLARYAVCFLPFLSTTVLSSKSEVIDSFVIFSSDNCGREYRKKKSHQKHLVVRRQCYSD